MSTTGKNFVSLTAAAGSGYGANGVALAVSPAAASSQAAAGLATLLDRFKVDLSQSSLGYTKTGCVVLSLAPSTPVTVDLTALSAVTVNAGDTSFAGWNELVFANLGSADVAVSPGASNPANTPLGGTSPTFTIPASARVRWHDPAGRAVDSTHKTLTFDPGASAATVALCVGGS